MRVIPYTQINGAWTLSDLAMGGLWDRMASDGTAQVVFPHGLIRDHHAFLALMKGPGTVAHVVAENDDVGILAWLNRFGKNHAFAHFVVFGEFRGTGKSVGFGQKSLEYWFSLSRDNRPILETIVGMIPVTNFRALEYVEKLGAKITGTIPGMVWDEYNKESIGATYIYFEREEDHG